MPLQGCSAALGPVAMALLHLHGYEFRSSPLSSSVITLAKQLFMASLLTSLSSYTTCVAAQGVRRLAGIANGAFRILTRARIILNSFVSQLHPRLKAGTEMIAKREPQEPVRIRSLIVSMIGEGEIMRMGGRWRRRWPKLFWGWPWSMSAFGLMPRTSNKMARWFCGQNFIQRPQTYVWSLLQKQYI